jgi:hypothetical protein
MKLLQLRDLFWLVLVCALGLPLLYFASYVVLLDPVGPSGSYRVPPGSVFSRTVHYRFGNGPADVVFAPLVCVDRKVRPGYWNFPLSRTGRWPGHTDGVGTNDEYSHPPGW